MGSDQGDLVGFKTDREVSSMGVRVDMTLFQKKIKSKIANWLRPLEHQKS